MKAIAFAPGHISGFFEPVIYPNDLAKSGSRGAGICLSLGAVSEVSISESNKQSIEIYINKKPSPAPVTALAIKDIIGESKLKVVVNTTLQLPIGQGFGMSGAGALSAAIATAKLIGLTKEDALKAAHFAEVKSKTGLGDVLASFFGGLEVRKSPGLPPWGLIEHIPCKSDVVICVIGKKINTKDVLNDESKIEVIKEQGKYCIKKLLENPSVENFFRLSQIFTKKIGIADEKVIEAIEATKDYGMSSMSMLGNSVFAIGDTSELCRVLSKFGKLFICFVDNYGARLLEV